MIDIPPQYDTPEYRPIFLAGYKTGMQKLYSYRQKGGTSLWEKMTPEQRNEKIRKMVDGRKKPIDSALPRHLTSK